MPDELIARLRRFREHTFPAQKARFETLVAHGQHPSTLFIGCSDSRVLPDLLIGAGPGELFMVRNVGAFVPPADPARPAAEDGHRLGDHGTAAAIEFAVLALQVARIVVCGHSHCGAIRAMYEGLPPGAPHLAAWLELGREALLPGAEPGPETLRRSAQRAIVLQLERLMDYPMVRERVEAGTLSLHGWYYVIEEGEVWVFDLRAGGFVPASHSEHSGTGPWPDASGPRD